jgi:hypothetical protein
LDSGEVVAAEAEKVADLRVSCEDTRRLSWRLKELAERRMTASGRPT